MMFVDGLNHCKTKPRRYRLSLLTTLAATKIPVCGARRAESRHLLGLLDDISISMSLAVADDCMSLFSADLDAANTPAMVCNERLDTFGPYVDGLLVNCGYVASAHTEPEHRKYVGVVPDGPNDSASNS